MGLVGAACTACAVPGEDYPRDMSQTRAVKDKYIVPSGYHDARDCIKHLRDHVTGLFDARRP